MGEASTISFTHSTRSNNTLKEAVGRVGDAKGVGGSILTAKRPPASSSNRL